MKIFIKNIKGEIFDLEVEDTYRISDIKDLICKTKNFEPEVQKLIFKGVVTVNEKSLKDYNIIEKDFMVLMTSKKAVPTINKSVQLPVSVSEPVQNKSTNLNNGLVFGEEFELAVDSLVNMGFNKPEVIRALHAAYNNPDRALDYLFNGIPDIFYMEQQLSQSNNSVPNIPIDNRNNEEMAIQRLVALGFRREDVTLAYNRSGKDENLAAHILITNGEVGEQNNEEDVEETE